MRIWHQSMADLTRLPGYEAMLREHATRVCDPGTSVDLHGVRPGSQEFIDSFIGQARSLIRFGVDVIIPAEGVLNTVLVHNKVSEVDGVPVLDSYGALLGMAQMLVGLRQRTGLRVGRGAAYFKASTAVVSHLRRVTGDVLAEMRALAEPEE